MLRCGGGGGGYINYSVDGSNLKRRLWHPAQCLVFTAHCAVRLGLQSSWKEPQLTPGVVYPSRVAVLCPLLQEDSYYFSVWYWLTQFRLKWIWLPCGLDGKTHRTCVVDLAMAPVQEKHVSSTPPPHSVQRGHTAAVCLPSHSCML